MKNIFLEQTPESSYWAGFIAADGCIYRPKERGPSLEFCMSEKDKSHLLKLLKEISFGGNVKGYINNIGAASIKVKVFNSAICQSLEDVFNIHPRKTFTLERPLLTKENQRHYIRGLFDGDGSLKNIQTNKSNYVDLDFNGTEDILEFTRDHLTNFCGAPNNSIFKCASIYRLSYRNSSARKVLQYISNDTNLLLDRKYIWPKIS